MLLNRNDIETYRTLSKSLRSGGKVEVALTEAQKLDLKPVLNEFLYYDVIQNTYVGGAGTIDTTGTTVTGTGTSFDSFTTDDYIAIETEGVREYRKFATITDATNATIASAFSHNLNDASYTTTVGKYYDLLFGMTYQIDSLNIEFEGIKPVLSYYAYARLLEIGDIHVTQAGNRVKNDAVSNAMNEDSIKYQAGLARSKAGQYQRELIRFLEETTTHDTLWNKDQATNVGRKGAINLIKL